MQVFEKELSKEREWRASLQKSSLSSAEKISQLHQEVDHLKKDSEVNGLPDFLLAPPCVVRARPTAGGIYRVSGCSIRGARLATVAY